MARKRRVRWDRVALLFTPVFILAVFLCVRCGGGSNHGEESSRGKATLEGTIPVSAAVTGTAPVQNEKSELLVVIDAGHGGGDSGCTDNNPEESKKRLEKDDNLRLALLVRDHLQSHEDVRVIMTREDDTFVSLKDRCTIANEAKAHLFVSLHRNAAENASGVEIWINSGTSSTDNTIDYRLAGYILSWLEDVGISSNRGIRTGFRNAENGSDSDSYYVNRNTNMPSCLVEMGFMTSDTDNANFDRRLNEYADAIASAIIEMSEDTGLTETEPAAEEQTTGSAETQGS